MKNKREHDLLNTAPAKLGGRPRKAETPAPSAAISYSPRRAYPLNAIRRADPFVHELCKAGPWR
jgi:hypothetical protein